MVPGGARVWLWFMDIDGVSAKFDDKCMSFFLAVSSQLRYILLCSSTMHSKFCQFFIRQCFVLCQQPFQCYLESIFTIIPRIRGDSPQPEVSRCNLIRPDGLSPKKHYVWQGNRKHADVKAYKNCVYRMRWEEGTFKIQNLPNNSIY